MWQEGDHQAEPTLLDAEIRSVRTELDEVTARRRGALDRYDVVSLVLMVVGLVVFASAAVASYASGQNGRGQVFAVLTLLAVPLVLVAAWRSVGRYFMLSRRVGRIRQREAQLAARLETLGGTVPLPAAPTVPNVTPSAPTAVTPSAVAPSAGAPTAVTPTPVVSGGARPSTTDAIGMLEAALPAYAVRGELGQGGCGMVFLAEHRQAGWLRALKLLTEMEFVPDSQVRYSREAQSRFLREAQVMESLDHPHVARVYEYVEHEGSNLIVMEYLSGGSAAARLAELLGRPEPICAIGLAVADALAAAHARGVVHRDIKPGNLLFAEDGAVKVTDFGIAKLLAGADGEPASILALTPGYAAPEQLNAGEITARTDLYGLAATLYRLFTGQTPPLPGVDGAPRTRMSAIPPGIAAVLERSLNGFPSNRHDSATSFALDLAAAAGTALRPGWLDAAGIPFRGAPPIRAAAAPS